MLIVGIADLRDVQCHASALLQRLNDVVRQCLTRGHSNTVGAWQGVSSTLSCVLAFKVQGGSDIFTEVRGVSRHENPPSPRW